MILEYLKQIHGSLFGYEINLFLYNKNLVYVATLIESQTVMRLQLIIKAFGTTSNHIYGVGKILAYALSIFPSTSVYK